MNLEQRKTIIFMIFFIPYWVSGTKGYIAKTLFEATNWDIQQNLFSAKKSEESGGRRKWHTQKDREGKTETKKTHKKTKKQKKQQRQGESERARKNPGQTKTLNAEGKSSFKFQQKILLFKSHIHFFSPHLKSHTQRRHSYSHSHTHVQTQTHKNRHTSFSSITILSARLSLVCE